jgi:PAS domain S-box-containing protein
MIPKTPKSKISFLSGGGEMGELIRQKDWRKNPVGTPEKWPQSLRTALSIILNSKFPMFLFWGPELICFYNDAYRPSLGNNGKHPEILGGRAQYYWSEIWADIKPIIDQVLAGGEASWSEDQLLPIYRNGKMEDVYWTFSYSAVYDESGKPSGVFVTCNETTKQVIALKRLEESEESFHTLADNMSQLAWMADEKGWIYWYNQRWYDYSGTTFEDMQGWGWQKIHHPDHLDSVVKNIQHSWDTGEVWEDTFPLRGQDGQYRWFLSRAIPIKDDTGKVVRWFGTNTDITKQNENAELLRKTKEQLELTFANVPAAIFLYNHKKEILFANEKAAHLLGYNTIEALLAEKYYDVLMQKAGENYDVKDENDAPFLRKNLPSVNALKVGQFGEVVFSMQRKLGGNKVWLLNKSAPILDEKGEVSMVLTTSTDITIQKSFTRELEQQVAARTTELKTANDMLLHQNELLTASENFNRSLTEVSPTMVYIHDIEKNKPIFLNNTYLNFVGYNWENVEELDNKFISTVVHPDDLAFCNDLLKKVIKSKGGEIFEGNFRRKNAYGVWVPFLNRVTAFKRNSKNEVTQIMGVAIDISDLKKAEDFLQQKNQDLENMNKELQSFAYISSHDLQEPLRKIQTFANRIVEKEYNNLSDSGKNYLRRMGEAAHRMRTLIDDLLAYSRTNMQERKFEKANLADIVEEVRLEFAEELEKKQAIFEATDLCECNVIPFQMRQLTHNLISNAIKFANPNHPPHIKIKSEIAKGLKFQNEKLEPEKEYCHIHITDNGIGFEQQYNEKIFEVFQRLHGKEKYSGTGIGLSIVKKIVDNHNGIITAKGELNKGATFDIYIPST